MDSVSYIVKSLGFKVFWIRTICNRRGKVGIILRTCINVKHHGNNGTNSSFLFDPMIHFDNLPNGTFEVIPLGPPDECDPLFPEKKCCQTWLVNGKTVNAKPPVQDGMHIKWKASLGGKIFKFPVKVWMDVCVRDICDDFDIIINDTIDGEVCLFKDKNLTKPYMVGESRPFLDCDRIFAKLKLDIDEECCSQFNASFTHVELFITRKFKPPKSIVIFDKHNPQIGGEKFKVKVFHDPENPCMPVICWLAKGLSGKHTLIDVILKWETTHIPPPLPPAPPSPSPPPPFLYLTSSTNSLTNADRQEMYKFQKDSTILTSIPPVQNIIENVKYLEERSSLKKNQGITINSNNNNNAYDEIPLSEKIGPLAAYYLKWKYTQDESNAKIEVSCGDEQEWDDWSEGCVRRRHHSSSSGGGKNWGGKGGHSGDSSGHGGNHHHSEDNQHQFFWSFWIWILVFVVIFALVACCFGGYYGYNGYDGYYPASTGTTNNHYYNENNDHRHHSHHHSHHYQNDNPYSMNRYYNDHRNGFPYFQNNVNDDIDDRKAK